MSNTNLPLTKPISYNNFMERAIYLSKMHHTYCTLTIYLRRLAFAFSFVYDSSISEFWHYQFKQIKKIHRCRFHFKCFTQHFISLNFSKPLVTSNYTFLSSGLKHMIIKPENTHDRLICFVSKISLYLLFMTTIRGKIKCWILQKWSFGRWLEVIIIKRLSCKNMIVLKTEPCLLERWLEVTANEGSTVSTCS